MIYHKKCALCNFQFKTNIPHKKFCSIDCYNKNSKIRSHNKYFSKLNRFKNKICPICKKSFLWISTKSPTCSKKCSNIKKEITKKMYHKKMLINSANYRFNNKEKRKAICKKWNINNPEKVKLIQLRYRTAHKNDIIFKFNKRISERLRNTIIKNKRSWISFLPYSKEELITYLFNNSKYTMNDFLNNKIDIDHKTPLSWFNYKSHLDKQFLDAWSLNNLQLLDHDKNIKKSNKYCSDVMLALSLIGR